MIANKNGFHLHVKKKHYRLIYVQIQHTSIRFFLLVDAILSILCSGIYSMNEFCQVHSLEQPWRRQEV